MTVRPAFALPDWLDGFDLGSTLLLIAVIGALVFMLAKLGWPLASLIKRGGDIMDDIQGEKERPGVPRRPGLMERQQIAEDALLAIKDGIDAIRSEMSANNAGVHEKLATDKRRLDRLDGEIADHEARLRLLEGTAQQVVHVDAVTTTTRTTTAGEA